MTFVESQLKFDEKKSKRVLGAEWNTKTGAIVSRFSNLLDQAKWLETTKRSVLTISTSFYDRFGMISRISVCVKTIFQLLCQYRLDMDDSVPREIEIILESYSQTEK